MSKQTMERTTAFTVARQIISNELEQAMECSLKRLGNA